MAARRVRCRGGTGAAVTGRPQAVVEPGHEVGRPVAAHAGRRPARWPAECRRAGGRSPRRRPDAGPGRRSGPRRAPGHGTARRWRRDPAARRPAPARRRRRGAHERWPARAPASRVAMAWTSSAAPSMTCSQLSMSSNAGRDRRTATIDCGQAAPRTLRDPSASATARGTSAGRADLRQLDQPGAAPRVAGRRGAAAASASRVLPIPPGPTRVTTGDPGQRVVDGTAGRHPGR